MAGKGGGAWKVAYADFVTAMMAFFMVMWLVGQKEGVKEAVAEYFREPPDPFSFTEGRDGYGSSTKPSTGKHRDDKPGASPKPNPEEDVKKPRGIRIKDDDHSSSGGIIQFDDNSIELSEHAKGQLREILPLLAGKPQMVEVRGHASRRPLPPDSPFKSNWDLCFQRSVVVMNYLEELGIPAERMRLSQAGGYEPMTPKLDPKYQSKNPRVEVFLLTTIAPSHNRPPPAGSDSAKTKADDKADDKVTAHSSSGH